MLAKFVVVLAQYFPTQYESFVTSVINFSWAEKRKHVGLLCLIQNLGCENLLKREPGLPLRILKEMEDATVANLLIDLYEACLAVDYRAD